jgi:hypothetical protein
VFHDVPTILVSLRYRGSATSLNRDLAPRNVQGSSDVCSVTSSDRHFDEHQSYRTIRATGNRSRGCYPHTIKLYVIAGGYSSRGGWFIWPGGLGLVLIVLLVLFMLRRGR